MSKKKRNKIIEHGGARENAGRPKTGITKKKICVSVDKTIWQAADDLWKKKPSWLIDGLISYYVKTGGSILKMEAAI